MSKESYALGFVKKASEYGVDPVSLAKYAAENNVNYGLGGVNWGGVKDWWNNLSPWMRLGIGVGGGALGGSLLSKFFGGSGLAGALVGGGLGATQVDWKALSDAFGDKKKKGANAAGKPEQGK